MSFTKLLIFLVKSTLILLVFKKYSKYKKINKSKVSKKMRTNMFVDKTTLPINRCLPQHSKGGPLRRNILGVVK